MNKKLINWWAGGASFDSDYQAWLTAGTTAGYTLPPSNVQTAQNNFVIALKAYTTMFAKLATLRFLHSGSVGMATLSVINTATEVGALSGTPPTFSEGNGIKSNGSSSYLRDSVVANKWANIEQDSTAIQYISESSTAFSTTQQSHGFRSDSSNNYIFNLTPLWNASLGVKGGYNAGTVGFPSTNHKGLYIHTVTATQSISYKDGSSDTDANTPVAPNISAYRLICARNAATTNLGVSASNYYPFYIALDAFAHGFTAQDAADFRTAFLAYQTAVGLP